MKTIRFMGFTVMKVMQSIFRSVMINRKGVEMVRCIHLVGITSET